MAIKAGNPSLRVGDDHDQVDALDAAPLLDGCTPEHQLHLPCALGDGSVVDLRRFGQVGQGGGSSRALGAATVVDHLLVLKGVFDHGHS